MTEFLVKSTIVMAVLLLLYHLLLEREKMHRFNRFYLLGALVLSIALPFIYIPVYVEAVAASAMTFQIAPESSAVSTQIPETDYWLYFVGALYAIVTVTFLVKFTVNLINFRRKINTNSTINYGGATLVLLKENILPHTFLNYIFVNQQEYENDTIENDLYTHELAHVNQKHTLDILFIEVLKTVFWFNPILYFYKRAVQMNHEFLADQAVIETTSDTYQYQTLLLNKAGTRAVFNLASNLNFSLTKKRFTMMTTSTSKTKKAILQAVILPVICSLTILLCTETIAQEPPITVDYTKVGKIEVHTPTQEEIDSLREVNPALYSHEPNTRILRTDYTVTEHGKEKVVTTYEKSRDYKPEFSELTKSGIAGIDPAKIQSIKVNSVTDSTMDSLKAAEPEYYKDAKAVDYKSITISYLDNESKQVKKTYYENNAPLKVTNQEQDKQPEFSEGNFQTYVLKHIKLPEIKEDISVKFYVSLIVEKDGSVTNVKILRDGGYGLGDEIKKVIEGSPKWKPGTKDGKPQRTSYVLPIAIRTTN